jgi:hypothetical protein
MLSACPSPPRARTLRQRAGARRHRRGTKATYPMALHTHLRTTAAKHACEPNPRVRIFGRPDSLRRGVAQSSLSAAFAVAAARHRTAFLSRLDLACNTAAHPSGKLPPKTTMLHGNATWLLTKSPEFADEHDLFKFVSEAYGSVAIGLLVLCCVPLSLSLVGSYLQDHADAWRPHWMKESWANTSDAYRLLLQEIYGGRRARIGRVLVGSGAIAMQALVLITIGQHLCGFRSSRGAHWGYLRLDPKDAPGLSLQGRCLAFVMVGVQILQGDTKRDFTILRYASQHPGGLLGNACAFLLGVIGCSIGVCNVILGAVLIVRSESVLKVLTSFAGLAYLAKIDNWFCNLFDLDSNDLRWLEPRLGAAHPPKDSGLLTLLRRMVAWVVYPGVFAYIFFVWIPLRSVPRW